MSDHERTYVEREVRTDAPRVERESVRETGEVHVMRESNSAAWWVAALVAIVALAGIFWMFGSNQQEVADLEAAREAGRLEAMNDTAALQAQSAALAAQQASADVARATEQAAASAAAASEAAARETQAAAASAADAAQDAAAEIPVVIEE